MSETRSPRCHRLGRLLQRFAFAGFTDWPVQRLVQHDFEVQHQAEFVDAVGTLLDDDTLRRRLGSGAREMSHQFTWEHAQESFAHVVAAVLRGERVDAQDPDAW